MLLIQCSCISNKPYLTCYRGHSACFSLTPPFPEFRKAGFLEAPPQTLSLCQPVFLAHCWQAPLPSSESDQGAAYGLHYADDMIQGLPSQLASSKFQWAPRFSSPERYYGAALFALCLASTKLNQCMHTRKPFNCHVPFAGPQLSYSSPMRASSLLTEDLRRLEDTLLFSHSATALGALL